MRAVRSTELLSVEDIWNLFDDALPREGRMRYQRCGCGCSYDFSRRLYSPLSDDKLCYDHLDMNTVDTERVTRLENLWRNFLRFGHDGRNPLGGKYVCLPTWLGERSQTA